MEVLVFFSFFILAIFVTLILGVSFLSGSFINGIALLLTFSFIVAFTIVVGLIIFKKLEKKDKPFDNATKFTIITLLSTFLVFGLFFLGLNMPGEYQEFKTVEIEKMPESEGTYLTIKNSKNYEYWTIENDIPTSNKILIENITIKRLEDQGIPRIEEKIEVKDNPVANFLFGGIYPRKSVIYIPENAINYYN